MLSRILLAKKKMMLALMIIWASTRENLSSGGGGGAINKGADQPLISTYVIRLLKKFLSRLATSEISIF